MNTPTPDLNAAERVASTLHAQGLPTGAIVIRELIAALMQARSMVDALQAGAAVVPDADAQRVAFIRGWDHRGMSPDHTNDDLRELLNLFYPPVMSMPS